MMPGGPPGTSGTLPGTAPGISPAPPTGAPAITFAPSSASVPLSGPLSINLNAQNVADLFSTGPVRLKWDPKLLRLNQIAPGDFLKQDGQNPPVIDIRNDTGEATISVSRTPGSAGANGSGVLATLSFIAIGKGSGSVNVVEAPLKDSKQKLISAAVPVLSFTVQ